MPSPEISIFGGYGSGVVAKVIMGSFDNSSGTTTGSIIGVKVVEKGEGYLYPPFVEISDDSNQGYGAVARSVINENGEVTDIYIVSEGENYPIDDSNTNFVEEIAITNPSDIPNYVSRIYVQQSGFGYKSTDIVFDDYGNTYSITVDSDGSIINVIINTPTDNTATNAFGGFGGGGGGAGGTGGNATSPAAGSGGSGLGLSFFNGGTGGNTVPNSILESVTTSSPRMIINNYVIVRNLPIITIESETGVGAILNPILDKLPIEVIQGNESSVKESKFIKDCLI